MERVFVAFVEDMGVVVGAFLVQREEGLLLVQMEERVDVLERVIVLYANVVAHRYVVTVAFVFVHEGQSVVGSNDIFALLVAKDVSERNAYLGRIVPAQLRTGQMSHVSKA